MRLADLRRLAIRQHLKIHFRLRNGMECIVNEAGIAQVPGLTSAPDFNLEDELEGAGEFLWEPAPPAPARTLQRAEMLAAAGSTTAVAAHEHDDE